VTGFARLGTSVLRIGLGVHAIAALAYWIVQPRGFALFTRSFVEHQVIAPAIFAVSVAGVAAMLLKRPPTGVPRLENSSYFRVVNDHSFSSPERRSLKRTV